jgi:threonine dehydrogenase-like Zn-dependent dehydrogenase
MKALCWYGTGDVRIETVPDPQILNDGDAIIKVTSTAICGSDLHMYDGFIPSMQRGDILGHECMGEVVEVGKSVTKLKVGDRVVVPFALACGNCFYCQSSLYSLCDNSNPNAQLAEKLYGASSAAGLLGYSHLFGGYAGGQAEYVRVPYADVGPFKVGTTLSDEQVLFLSDILPTGYQAAEQCDIKPGQVVAVWGAGPVGLFTMISAKLLGAERVIAIDSVPRRLQLAAEHCGAIALNYEEVEIGDALMELTGGRGPDACIDAVGMEAHGMGVDALYDRAKQAVRLETDRPTALRQAIYACRKGGTVSVPGVYGGFVDKMPIGAIFNKGLTIRAGQTHVHRYMPALLERIERGEVDPAFLITHRLRLEDAPQAYHTFRHERDNCVKVVLQP